MYEVTLLKWIHDLQCLEINNITVDLLKKLDPLGFISVDVLEPCVQEVIAIKLIKSD